jgi:hypothetical protein
MPRTWIYRPSLDEELLQDLEIKYVKTASISKVKKEVSRKFPEMAGVKPTVRKQEMEKSRDEQYLLTFKGKADLPGGRKISRVVRVVADERGRILKLSTSK